MQDNFSERFGKKKAERKVPPFKKLAGLFPVSLS
jgi:hypothetical protein